MSENYSLKQNLASAMGQAPNPFTQAQQMPSPFPDWIMGGEQGPSAEPMAQPKLADIQEPTKQASFQDLAKQLGLDMKGLSNNPQLGKLQILQRLGPAFTSHPQFADLMKAWDSHASAQPSDKTDAIGMNSRAKRTLAALVGSP